MLRAGDRRRLRHAQQCGQATKDETTHRQGSPGSTGTEMDDGRETFRGSARLPVKTDSHIRFFRSGVVFAQNRFPLSRAML
ncbi:hypothetical protein C100_15875 [Sphingobium sp. C100]|nr:hypothetical protein C100_15875 [Sphingobium sp. C100]